ncbi:MAG: amidohydrolase family protein, partial [Gemmatimonadetes bacterium]|nr:amidohydrolase family protein [Gemmatimonadota bacterium]NIQ57759.1 amidohydrolase family protein [Gemmatimonadota bacterium]NIU77915.1 amidohydrolase family protein [Gammaproteobacteria bacterium]NIX47012.1 amidohydrolase family protein [Gemmatimonadota bacterium]NIY11378.1 amidohydrolase family protein [Gemmatimonadota bacterium]
MKRELVLAALVCTVAGSGAAQGAAQEAPADLVLRNAQVVTVDSARPEAEAVAIRGDRIIAVGSNREIEGHTGPGTRVLDLEGRLVVPGFIEGHGHFMGVGTAQLNLDLTGAADWDEIVDMVAAAAGEAAPGAWILGRGWHQEKWTRVPDDAVDGVPTHHALSAVSPDNPVVLTHASGHAALVNARALELAGIDADYRAPEGGEVVRDADGSPTGLLRENAQDPVGAVRARAEATRTAAEREARFRRVVALAAEEALSKGVTTFHDAGVG